jgi:hypothetical protein
MYRSYYPVDNPSDYWKISLYNCLLGSFSGRNIKASSKPRGTFMLASYLNLASPLNLTPEIVDRLFNAYQTDLPRKLYFVDEVELWKIRWVLVDDKPETTRHSTCNKPVHIFALF